MAGLIKTALALHHGELPPTLHFHQPHPDLAWNPGLLRIDAERKRWPEASTDRFAGVSSFSLSGTMAYVVLQSVASTNNRKNAPVTVGDVPSIVPLSARSTQALRDLAGRYVDLLENGRAPALADIAYTTAHRSMHHPHRLGIVANSSVEFRKGLQESSRTRCLTNRYCPRAELFLCFPDTAHNGREWTGVDAKLAGFLRRDGSL